MPDSTDASEQPLSIAHVVTDVHRPDSGLASAAISMAAEVAAVANVTLHALTPPPATAPAIPPVYHRRLPLARSVGISPDMKRSLARSGEVVDVMHVHGLWTMASIYADRATRSSSSSFMVSPHGMLEPWSLQWHHHRKAPFWKLLQRPVLERVDCFHATSIQEAESIRKAGFTAPVAVVPLGVDIPAPREPVPRTERTVLYLGRLHPKKNIESLLMAWAAASGPARGWELVIAGPGEAAYVHSLHHLAKDIERVTFSGPAYGDDKARLLQSADLFVLPTHSENFGIVVAEALSYAIPVIATTGTPWQGLQENSCGWWIDPDIESLTETLEQALVLDRRELEIMGRAGATWIEKDFSWKETANKLLATYAWLTSGSATPSWIIA